MSHYDRFYPVAPFLLSRQSPALFSSVRRFSTDRAISTKGFPVRLNVELPSPGTYNRHDLSAGSDVLKTPRSVGDTYDNNV